MLNHCSAWGRWPEAEEWVEAQRPADWPALTWQYMVTRRTQQLARSEPFTALYKRLVLALAEIGDFGTLSGAELREVLGEKPQVRA